MKKGTMSMEDFINEAKTMHTLRHHRLVQLMGVCTLSEPILIITELMANGSLIDYLRNDEGRTLKFSNFIEMATDVCSFWVLVIKGFLYGFEIKIKHLNWKMFEQFI